MEQKKLKLVDLAKLAGVSTSTASRALNNNPVIKQATRDHVQQLAKQHNFTLNTAASRLRLQKTKVIAVVINLEANTEQSIDDPFLLKVVSDINQAVNRQGYELLLSNSYMAGDDWYGYFIDGRRADGLIVVGQGKQQNRIEQAANLGAPLVVWGDPKTPSNYPIVGSDNYLGGLQATAHLIARGASKLLFLGDPGHAEIGERYRGFKAAIDGASEACQQQTVKIDITSQAAYEAINQLLRSEGLTFDGIFACSDMVALGALKALKERYVSVPNDVRLVGFDDIGMADVSHPSLSTVRQNTQLAAKMLVTKLLAQLNNEVVDSQEIDIELLCRQSS
ncbi:MULTISPECIES: LacI family DNA-binding transcriptional regulator [Pseudoalteromonas]|uniref:LacI family transcriptional regulator n=1 Tax=Pseudoalteromonas amylolytica TaxID=1859457 RepID=A0A1S1MPD1_9GAMM|nr:MULTISPECIES: substrate-binding domain-containing protein [Pseudoalteromonas]OHU84269.1 LacI family transcriptional regulator [Pseudoalteromonas sp. JW3]OHU87191.1 LacI family transcriptional regulator [Pseudoalteromonas amylolytica]